jgi:hypothetical protein
MDPEVAKLMAQSAAQGHMSNMSNIALAGQNLAQGLGVVNTAVIQAQASVSDDPGLVTAFQTAARAPDQGAIKN